MAVDADGRLSGVITVEQVGRALTRRQPSYAAAVLCVAMAIERNCRTVRRRRAVAVDDAAEVGAGGQGAEGLAPVAGEAGGAEGVGDGLVAVADQQRGLQGERHPLDHAAGAGLDRLDVAGELVAQGWRRRRRGAARRRRPRSTSAKKASTEAGLLTIARRTSRHWTLPEPSQIELSGLSRKRRGIPDSST